MSSKLFVGGLPWSVTSGQLRDVFLEHGEVLDAKVVTDRHTGRSRGFGFVLFTNEAQAHKALAVDGTMIEGRRLRVEIARDRRDRS
jgi:RNA recognition motif-containing protein